METLQFVTLDVFTSTPYEGNPLAVVRIPTTLKNTLTQEKKQAIAKEFNLSETVFVHEQKDADKLEWEVDIFTTTDEVPFAGHPTIGAAYHVLSRRQESDLAAGVLVTKAGRIPIKWLSGRGTQIQIAVPHNVHIHKRRISDLGLLKLGLSEDPALMEAEGNAPVVSIVKGMTFLLVKLSSIEELAAVRLSSPQFDFHDLLDTEGGWGIGLIARYYYVVLPEVVYDHKIVKVRTRMLEANLEDSATGSAASALCSYLALKAWRSLDFEVVQGVEIGRRSILGVRVAVDEGSIQSVQLNGTAVQIMEGITRV